MAVIEKVRQPKVSARTAARKAAPVDTRVLPLEYPGPEAATHCWQMLLDSTRRPTVTPGVTVPVQHGSGRSPPAADPPRLPRTLSRRVRHSGCGSSESANSPLSAVTVRVARNFNIVSSEEG